MSQGLKGLIYAVNKFMYFGYERIFRIIKVHYLIEIIMTSYLSIEEMKQFKLISNKTTPNNVWNIFLMFIFGWLKALIETNRDMGKKIRKTENPELVIISPEWLVDNENLNERI